MSEGWAMSRRLARVVVSFQPSIMLQYNKAYSGTLMLVVGLALKYNCCCVSVLTAGAPSIEQPLFG